MRGLATISLLFISSAASSADCVAEPAFPGLVVRAGPDLGKGACPTGSTAEVELWQGARVTCRGPTGPLVGLEELWWKSDPSVDSFALISKKTLHPWQLLTWKFDAAGRLERVGSACTEGSHDVEVEWFASGAVAKRTERRDRSPFGTWTRFEQPGVLRKRLVWADGGSLERVETLYPGGGVSSRGTGGASDPSSEGEDAERWALFLPDGGALGTVEQRGGRWRFELTAGPAALLEAEPHTFMAVPNDTALSEQVTFSDSQANKTFTSQGPKGHRLRVEVAPSFRACLEHEGLKPACVSSRLSGAGFAVAWSTGGFVWLRQEGHGDGPFGPGLRPSWVWSLATHRVVRTYDREPTQLLGQPPGRLVNRRFSGEAWGRLS